MSQQAGDLRVRRTQKLIREAFIALLEERGFDAITVGDIAGRAMVSRTAFYRYYEDKYDLAMKILESVLATMNAEVEVFRQRAFDAFAPDAPTKSWEQFVRYAEDYVSPWETFFAHVARHARLYHALLGKGGNSWFTTHMRVYFAQVAQSRLLGMVNGLGGNTNEVYHVLKDGFVSAQIAGLLINTIIWWLDEQQAYTPRQIASYFFHMMSSILNDLPTWERPI